MLSVKLSRLELVLTGVVHSFIVMNNLSFFCLLPVSRVLKLHFHLTPSFQLEKMDDPVELIRELLLTCSQKITDLSLNMNKTFALCVLVSCVCS